MQLSHTRVTVTAPFLRPAQLRTRERRHTVLHIHNMFICALVTMFSLDCTEIWRSPLFLAADGFQLCRLRLSVLAGWPTCCKQTILCEAYTFLRAPRAGGESMRWVQATPARRLGNSSWAAWYTSSAILAHFRHNSYLSPGDGRPDRIMDASSCGPLTPPHVYTARCRLQAAGSHIGRCLLQQDRAGSPIDIRTGA